MPPTRKEHLDRKDRVENPPQISPKSVQNLFKIDAKLILGRPRALGGPSAAQERQSAPLAAPQESHGGSPRVPKSAPRAERECPGGAQELPKRASMSPGRLEQKPWDRQNRSKAVPQPCWTPTPGRKRARNRFWDDFCSFL